ncbi:MAG: hypothetical protein WD825_13100 [Gemmatimonadaceae bacterium]
MRRFGGARLVGAYLCPRGVFAIECRRTGAGLEVARTFEVPALIESAFDAAEHLIRVLRGAGIRKAEISVAMRGFGVVHHVLQMPPAKDEVLGPIIEREVRHLEPQLGDAIINWIPLPALDANGSGAPPQRSLLSAAAPRNTVRAVEERLQSAGYRLAHLTALSASMQRVLEELDMGGGTAGLFVGLPDGAFLGFSINGGIRLVTEPPMPENAEHVAAALTEELELGATFVRQQFNGAAIDYIALVGSNASIADADTMVSERLHIPFKHVGTRELSPQAFAALGAILDNQSPKPLSLGGASRARTEAQSVTSMGQLSYATLFVLALLGAWTILETVRTKQADDALQVARRRIEQDSFGLAPIRSTAERRRMVRDAAAAMRTVATDRVALQEALAGVAATVRPPVRIDTLSLALGETGWRALLGGRVEAATNARAVQALHDMYRQLPQRLSVDSLRLEQLAYSDSGASTLGSIVRFQVSFEIPAAKKD